MNVPGANAVEGTRRRHVGAGDTFTSVLVQPSWPQLLGHLLYTVFFVNDVWGRKVQASRPLAALLASLFISGSWQRWAYGVFFIRFQNQNSSLVFMIIKLFSEAPQTPWSFLWITKELKKSLFSFLGLSIYDKKKNVKKWFLTEKRCDSLYWLTPNIVTCPYDSWCPSNLVTMNLFPNAVRPSA